MQNYDKDSQFDRLKSRLFINVYSTGRKRGEWKIETFETDDAIASAHRITGCSKSEINEYSEMTIDSSNPIFHEVQECLKELQIEINAVFIEDGKVIFKPAISRR